MKILILGKNGQVGSKISSLLNSQKSLETVSLDRDVCDVTKIDHIQEAFERYKPDLVINATAYTAVDQAEKEPDLAFQVNAGAVHQLAKVAKEKDVWFIHYSTDYVFKGDKESPYNEKDATNPTGVYGASKLQGERSIIETHNKYIILRTSWVYGEHGNNFPKTILKLAQERDTLNIIDDQVGIPTYTNFISEATHTIIQRLIRLENSPQKSKYKFSGVYHLTSKGACSWFEFAKYFIEYARDNSLSLECNHILPVGSHDYPTIAQRPSNSVLDTTKLIKTFNIVPYDWRKDVEIFVQNYILGNIS